MTSKIRNEATVLQTGNPYMGGGFVAHTPYAAGTRRPSVHSTYAAMSAQVNRVVNEVMTGALYPQRFVVGVDTAKPAAPRKGDKVRIVVEGYVGTVNADGTFDVLSTREPYVKNAQTLVEGATAESSSVLERRPEPKVGDVIIGRTLREVPWKRGTLIKGSTGYVYMLTADGDWLSITTRARLTFAAFQAPVTVEYVGK